MHGGSKSGGMAVHPCLGLSCFSFCGFFSIHEKVLRALTALRPSALRAEGAGYIQRHPLSFDLICLEQFVGSFLKGFFF